MWEYRARLVRVVDGDTIVALMDTGFGGRQEEHLRLEGVSAPELGQPGGQEARQFAIEWAASASVRSWPLLIRTQPNSNIEPTERRTLTRYLAKVLYINSSFPSLNSMLRVYLAEHPEWGTGS